MEALKLYQNYDQLKNMFMKKVRDLRFDLSDSTFIEIAHENGFTYVGIVNRVWKLLDNHSSSKLNFRDAMESECFKKYLFSNV